MRTRQWRSASSSQSYLDVAVVAETEDVHQSIRGWRPTSLFDGRVRQTYDYSGHQQEHVKYPALRLVPPLLVVQVWQGGTSRLDAFYVVH